MVLFVMRCTNFSHYDDSFNILKIHTYIEWKMGRKLSVRQTEIERHNLSIHKTCTRSISRFIGKVNESHSMRFIRSI